MKSILLASASIVAFAGAAAADVTFGGDAELGYNDDIDGGVYYGVGLSVDASQELDNGLTVGFSLDVDLLDNAGNTFDLNEVTTSDYVLSLTTATAGLYFGDTAYAADDKWTGVTNMEADTFNENGDLGEDAVLRGEASFGAVDAAVSYALIGGDFDGLTFGASIDAGAATITAAYQDDTFTGDDVFGLTAAGTFGGVDATVSYADNGAESSIGVQVAYPFGPVTATVFYVSNDVADDNYGLAVAYASGALSVDAFYHDGADEDHGINVSYDVGNGLAIYAGFSDDDGAYVAGEYDLGGGAALLVAYGDDAGNDEIGPNEYKDGFTIEASFSF